MARKENLKALFTNSRTRIILLITALIMLFLIVFGVFKLLGNGGSSKDNPSASLVGVPGNINTIAGAENTTPERARLTTLSNQKQFKQAQKTGQSAIPTIVRLQSQGDAGQGLEQETNQGIGFAALSRASNLGAQKNLWLQALTDGNCSKNVVQKIIGEGATLAIVKQACSCAQLKDNGYGISELNKVCSCNDLRKSGFNARQFKNAGYDAAQLRSCGFDACQLRNAGFTAQELKDGGFSDGELRGAGYSQDAIDKASGLPPGITAADVRKAGCSAQALRRLRQAGVSAAAIVRISGCSAKQLKAAGYTAAQLRNAGFTAAQLKKAGFTPEDLRKAGYSARDLLNAGYTPEQLAQAGYSPAEIKAAEAESVPGISEQDIKNAGCSKEALEKERLAGISAKLIHEYAGCSAKALKSAGFSDQSLANAGFTPEEIKAAGAPSDDAIKAAGCDVEKLRKLREQGVSSKKIRELNGCSAKALNDAGFGIEALKDARFTPQQLLAAGYTPQQLSQAGINPISAIADGRKKDCSVASLQKARAAGVSVKSIRETLGCTAKQLKAAGYTAAELRAAGYTAAQLKDAGFSAAELKAAGFNAKQLKDAGFSADELKNAGFNAKQLKDAGFSAADLKAAGFNAKQLKDAGFGAAELKAAGFSAKQLKDAGFSASQLKDAGFSAKQLEDAGFSAADLKNAGFSPDKSNVIAPPSEAGTTRPSVLSDIASRTNTQKKAGEDTNQQLQQLLSQQQRQVTDQRFQQTVKQRTSAMLASANSSIKKWEASPTQTYIAGEGEDDKKDGESNGKSAYGQKGGSGENANNPKQKPYVQTGDILFAVMDTSVNSDEQGPVLATIVSGRFKGAKLIGSFAGPSKNSDKITLSFNTMTIPGGNGSISIGAYAIDPNTARTALSSRTDKHFFSRYGSLFAATFLEGFGDAFQSADTSITIGGTGGGDNISVSNGINRSALENAVIGLATVGKAWGQVAQQNVNRPPTVELFSGTSIGVLFTQDLTSL